MDITRTLTFAALLLNMGVGYARTAGGAAVTTMIVMDSAQKKAEAERDGTLAATPVAQCSMCHQEILPFTHLPVIPDTTIMGHNTTEPIPNGKGRPTLLSNGTTRVKPFPGRALRFTVETKVPSSVSMPMKYRTNRLDSICPQ